MNPGLGLYGELLQLYAGLHFIKEDGGLNLKTVVDYTTEVLISHGLKNVPMLQNVAGVWIYPRCYFNPKDYETGKMTITENTYSIHHLRHRGIHGMLYWKKYMEYLWYEES